MRRHPLLLLLAFAAAPAAAQQAVVLDEIVVDAGREDSEVDTNAPAAVTVIDRAEIQKQGGATIADILQSAPGVIAPTAADDPATAVNIRGLGDFDRVTVTVDGARQNFARSGHGANGGFYLDRDMVKAVEVTRGPNRAVGGVGVGGAVAITTIDAGDVLREGETVAVRVKSELETNMPAGLGHAEVAGRIGDAFDLLAAGTVRKADDFRDGSGEEVRSAQELLSGLVKARVRVADGHETILSAQRIANEFDNGISTVRHTEQATDTLVASHRYTSPDNPFIDALGRIYTTSTELDQKDVSGDTLGAKRWFDVETTGGELFNTAAFETFGIAHTTTIGGDGFHDEVKTFDDLNLSSGSTPSGNRNVYGVYVEHSAQRGWFELLGALRYDGYSLDGTIRDRDPPKEVSREGGHLSPKVTLAVTPIEPVTVYATYAEAYRSPSVTETLVQGIHPPPVNFPFIPNPNLRPEIAHNLEAGLNLRFDDVLFGGDTFRAKGAIYRNLVDDYIGLDCFAFPFPGGCKYINIDRAELKGIELEAWYDAGWGYSGIVGSLVEGRDLGTDEDLQSVPPSRLAMTAGVRVFEGKLDVGGTLTLVDDKPDAEEFGLSGEGYALIDAYARYTLDEDTEAMLTLRNLTDRRYVQYLNLEPSPGFSAVVTLSRRFGGNPKFF